MPIHLVFGVSLLWGSSLFPTPAPPSHAGITGGPLHPSNIYMGVGVQTQVLTLEWQKLSLWVPGEAFGLCLFPCKTGSLCETPRGGSVQLILGKMCL